ncbi:MAG: YHYH protein [Rhodospirillales bacterium]|nr:YHYH protein [Rhodospirillales bacterium]MBO6787906.1 YHYH protein [Rhodospirillales bacterium]
MPNKIHRHAHHRIVEEFTSPPLVDQKRRQLVTGLGLLPAALMLSGIGRAWALSNRVSIGTEGPYRVIRSNAIPDHDTGRFPNPGNPNAITAQDLSFRAPLQPARAGRYTIGKGWNFGVAVNGVPFDPFTAEFWLGDRNWNYDAIAGFVDLGLDENNAHVQPGGKYHYHGWPKGLIRAWSPNSHSPIIGWAADGFPIYAAYGYADPADSGSPIKAMTSGWRVRQGARQGGPGGSHDGRFFEDWEWLDGKGDLDRANGRQTVTPEFPNGTYAYFLTESWPVIPRYFAGTPDRSFRIGPPSGGHGPGMRPPPRGMHRPPPPGGMHRRPPGGGLP